MKKFSGVLALVLLFPHFASAVSITEFVEVTSGSFDDPNDGNRTFAIRINTNGNDWTNSDIRVELTQGSMIHHLEVPVFGSPFEAPDPQDPYIGDSAVWSPIPPTGDFTQNFPSGTSIANPTYDSTNENAQYWDVSWFNTATDDIGIFDIGMITFSPDAEGFIYYRTVSFNQTLGESEVEDGGYGSGYGIFICQGIWPEPGSLALVGIGVVGLLGTRRRN